MIPKLASKETIITALWWLAIIVVTIINTATMVFGQRPAYDYERHLTAFNAAPAVGISIAILASLSFLPAAILFGVNAVKSHGARRVRSGLLAAGFFIEMVGGPMHDNAHNWQTYMIADITTIIGIIVVGIGVAYRLNQSLATDQSRAQPVAASPSSPV